MSWENIFKEDIWSDEDTIDIQWCIAMLYALVEKYENSALTYGPEVLRIARGMLVRLDKISAKIDKETQKLVK